MKFRDYLMESRLQISKKKYDWGILRKIEVGNSFSVIIHPEHWEVIERCLKTRKTQKFTDEQGYKWTINCDGTNIDFKAGSKKVTVSVDDIKKKLG